MPIVRLAEVVKNHTKQMAYARLVTYENISETRLQQRKNCIDSIPHKVYIIDGGRKWGATGKSVRWVSNGSQTG